MKLSDSLTIAEGVAIYLRTSGFEPSGYGEEKWSRIQLGPIFFYIPNTKTRQSYLKVHCMHHVATNYPPNLKGEAQIAAWEIARGGFGFSPFIWSTLVFGALVGIIICPAETLKAFRLGRRSRNLFREDPSRFVNMSVGELRRDLGL